MTYSADPKIDQLTGKQNTMGIIEAIKKIEREEAFEKGLEKGKTDFVIPLLISLMLPIIVWYLIRVC